MMALDSFLKIYYHAEFLVLQVFIYNHYFLQSNYLKLMNLGSLQILLLILSKIRSEIWSETWIFSLLCLYNIQTRRMLCVYNDTKRKVYRQCLRFYSYNEIMNFSQANKLITGALITFMNGFRS